MSTGTVPSTGPRFNSRTIAAQLLNGDGTISITGVDYAGSGILVAIPEFGATIDIVDLETTAAIEYAVTEWVSANAAAILNFPAPFYNPRYFGVWEDSNSGLIHLDIVEAFPREELNAAIDAGIARNQIAIYDNGRGELYATGGVA